MTNPIPRKSAAHIAARISHVGRSLACYTHMAAALGADALPCRSMQSLPNTAISLTLVRTFGTGFQLDAETRRYPATLLQHRRPVDAHLLTRKECRPGCSPVLRDPPANAGPTPSQGITLRQRAGSVFGYFDSTLSRPSNYREADFVSNSRPAVINRAFGIPHCI